MFSSTNVLEPGDEGEKESSDLSVVWACLSGDSLMLTRLSLGAGLGSSNCLSSSDVFFRLFSAGLGVCANGWRSITSLSTEPRGVPKTSLSLSEFGSGVITLDKDLRSPTVFTLTPYTTGLGTS